MIKKIITSMILTILIVGAGLKPAPTYAGEKTWVGAGDGATWASDDNWYEAGAPTTADNVTIDAENAAVTCAQTFYAKSIAIGGRETSSLTVNNYIYGTIAPASTSSDAVYVRSGGTITLTGAGGTVVLKGSYKDSEESLTAEPSFMFWLQ